MHRRCDALTITGLTDKQLKARRKKQIEAARAAYEARNPNRRKIAKKNKSWAIFK